MAAHVRLRSTWSVALLACLVIVHFDDGVVGFPLQEGGRGDPTQGGMVLLEQDAMGDSERIMRELAEARRMGSGEVAYSQAKGSEGKEPRALAFASQSLVNVPVHKVSWAIGKAAQMDLLASLGDSFAPQTQDEQHSDAVNPKGPAGDMFSKALSEWDKEKSALENTSTEKAKLLDVDLENQSEVLKEKQLVSSVGKARPVPMVMSANPPETLEKQSRTHIAKHSALGSSLKNKAEGQDWMTSALAAWGKEEQSSLEPGDLPDPTQRASAAVQGDNEMGESSYVGASVHHDLGESGDVGDSDSVDATAATAEKNMSKEIESEAQEAASEVVSSTMKSVEKDFLFAEKAITHKLGENSPVLTLADLDKAGGQQKVDKTKAEAKKAHKEMVQKAHENYELAIASVKKTTQQELADELVGLKMKLRQAEDKIMGEQKTEIQKAREDMEERVRNRSLLLVEKMKAELPAKLAGIKEKAEHEAQEVATMAIKEVTQGARRVRMRLQQDLGEAAGRVESAEVKLASSDNNPSLALKAAVDVRTEKSKYAKLHDLAESALSEQKTQASEKIITAEQNAKESVHLAVKDAEAKELKESRGALQEDQKKVEEEEQSKLEKVTAEVKKRANVKIQQQRKQFKSLVDAAVKLAPNKEKDLRMKAKISLHKAKMAAEAYEETMLKSVAPKTANGKTMTDEMAAECITNPAGCSSMSLKGGNIAAAAKFAESKARKAKRAQIKAKESVSKAMEKLRVTSTVARKYAQEARDMDEKETRIKLAELQLNEAKAASAFHSAAKAHLQSQLVHTQMNAEDHGAESKLKQFDEALAELKVTHSESVSQDAASAKSQKVAAFAKAQEAAKALLQMSAPA